MRSLTSFLWKMWNVENAESDVIFMENAECGKCGVWKMRSVENAESDIIFMENEECGKCGV